MIGYIVFGLIVFVIFILLQMATLFVQIEKHQKNQPYKGFWKDVANNLISSTGKSFSFIPIIFIGKNGDPEAIKMLRRRRNIWVVFFWLTMAAIFFIGFIFGDNPNLPE